MDEKFIEVLKTPPDAALSIVTQGEKGPHVVNSWNSYVLFGEDGVLLIPVGRMHETEKNVQKDDRVKLTVSNREVEGKTYKGTGFLVTGRAQFETEGANFDLVKKSFPWARAALVIKVESTEQTL